MAAAHGTSPQLYADTSPQLYADTIAGLLLLLVVALAVGHMLHARRIFFLPESAATILIGAAAGLLLHMTPEVESSERLLLFDSHFFQLVLLPPIIFESGLSLNRHLFMEDFRAIALFAVVGTVISTGFIWLAIHEAGRAGLIPALSLLEAGSFAALISAVDPVATLATFGVLKVWTPRSRELHACLPCLPPST